MLVSLLAAPAKKRKGVSGALLPFSGLDNQEHGLDVFVVAVNWLVSRLNYSCTCRLAEECSARPSSHHGFHGRKLLM